MKTKTKPIPWQCNPIPNKLYKAFLMGSRSRWKDQTIYYEYRKQADEYLGKKYCNDKINQLNLIVCLSRIKFGTLTKDFKHREVLDEQKEK